ncbi:MAG: Stk1 family PASTA domain-containing Ser/Thr kinase [Microbacteriaceae bacterium]|nr:Stk1 family PASTA domain-containing Ser/Thr kinase [Microbacteriaceae bacterium]
MSSIDTDPLVGHTVDGRYHIQSRIARGGMATVYLATDSRLDRPVALKIMHQHLADDPAFRSKFVQEARSAARLTHPNVVNVFDQGINSQIAYLVMEYLPGITLRELLGSHGNLTQEQTLDILQAIVAGVSAAHEAGILHRDLKPENVLLADDGRIKIGDFGLARATSSATATGQALLGTIAYLAPELLTRGTADQKSDIYSLGIMAYEMLTGSQPYTGERPMQIAMQHTNSRVPAPSSKTADIIPEFDNIIAWATDPDPEERPSTARELLNALTALRPLVSVVGSANPTAVLSNTIALPLTQNETMLLSEQIPEGDTATGAIKQVALKRKRSGALAFIMVIVLAIAAATTGWYFGAGPGASVTIPATSGGEVSSIEEQLTALGLDFVHEDRYDAVVDIGKVSGTDPAAGEVVKKGVEVTIYISIGPRDLPVPTLVGLSEADAIATIQTASFTADQAIIREFSTKIDKGVVIAALDANGNNLKAEDTYPELRPITLVVSAGALPAVANLDPTDAISILEAVGLFPQQADQVYSDTIAAGKVTRVYSPSGSQVIRVGDAVVFDVSKGPELITIPKVINLKWNKAKKLLTDAGFKLSYNEAADSFPGFFTVAGVSPSQGTQAPKGSVVTVTFSGF